MDRVTRVLGSFFGLGFLPGAPGSWGTLGGVALVFLLPSGMLWPALPVILFMTVCVLTIRLGDHAERTWKQKDPGFIVLDEVAGYLVTAAAAVKPGPGWILAAFVLFRIFDVTKPWPCRRLEKLGGGKGILYDDLMAGFYALLVLLVLRLLPFVPDWLTANWDDWDLNDWALPA